MTTLSRLNSESTCGKTACLEVMHVNHILLMGMESLGKKKPRKMFWIAVISENNFPQKDFRCRVFRR